MPTTRVRRVRAVEITYDDRVRTHLELGDCLLVGPGRGCACGLRDASGAQVVEAMRHLWDQHKRSIAKTWRNPFPTFAAALLDRQTFPPHDAQGWDERTRGTWAIIAEELERAQAEAVPVLPGSDPAV